MAEDMSALRAADPRHYDDRRSHLVGMGATDVDIQRWVQIAVDKGLAPREFLKQIEDYAGVHLCSLEAAVEELLEDRRWKW